MFKLIKLMFWFGFVFVIVMACLVGYGFTFYHVVQTKDGYHFLEKDDPAFELGVIDTREWTLADRLKNLDITKELAKIRWESWSERVSQRLGEFSGWLDEQMDEAQTKDYWKDASSAYEGLQKEAEKRYREVEKLFKEGDIDFESMQKRLEEIRLWVEARMKALQEQFQ